MSALITRRQFLVGASAGSLGLVAGCGRLPWQAEPRAQFARIGWLRRGTAVPWHDAFRDQLRELGYVEGQNVAIEWRFAEREEQLPDLAAELVGLPVDIIVVAGTPAIRAAKSATTAIPIVMVTSGDPVGTGLVASLAHPGGNVTGQSILSPPLAGKQLELLKELVPGLSRVAVLWDAGNPASALNMREIEFRAQALGLAIQGLDVRGPEDFESAFAAATTRGAGGLITQMDTLFPTYRRQIVDLAADRRLPAAYGERLYVLDGGLMSYGPSLTAMYRRAAYYVDRILKGTKPADLPVEQPMTFDFVVNLKTAQQLGVTFPPEIMLQVTEVIQ